jgi:D-arginine dehydrogenase
MVRTFGKARVVVVGAGIAGLATAWQLALRGHAPLVLERESGTFAHSSGLNAGILRAVVEDAAIAAVAGAGARALLEPHPDLGARSFVDPVGVLLTADREESARHLAEMVAIAEVPVRAIEPAEVRRRCPHVATAALVAYESPSEGTIDLERLAASLCTAVERRGGRVRLGAAVAELLGSSGAVTGVALASGERIDADVVVLAAGGWAGELGARAGSRVVLEPTRRHAALVRPTAPVDPRWPVVWNSGSNFYSRPMRGGLMVCDCDQTPVAPDALALDRDALQHLSASLRRHLAAPWSDVAVDVEAALVAPTARAGARPDVWCAMRTFAGDHRFAIGPDPDVDGLAWAAALGGHGITCGLEVGRLAASAVLGDHEPQLAALAPARTIRAVRAR